MNTRIAHLVLAAAAAGLLAPAARAATDSDYAAYFEDQCVGCHTLKKKPVDDKRMSRQEWQDAVDKMVRMDKLDDPVPSKQFLAGLVDWLARTHGPDAGK